ncbi:hypothetical protein BHM03_00031499 [Ensete ventricosum]|uniref:Uncharacterized protein n=1 Tax=Ensete ventricosum TaxID=4639 RepID=A0A445MII6_ENSVE|nr:hypothetical protein BHM03_00031499 [Ensete ventricosum]
MASDMPYRAIYARNATTCSIGSEPPSYASSIGRRKCCGIGVSWISWTKGEPQRKLSTRSSFVLIVIWMSLILWFTKHNCALKELVEYEESVSESSKLRTDELGVGASRLATLPKRGCPWKASGVTTGVPRFVRGGVSPGSLNKRQYHPGVCKGRFPSPNKGSGGCGASLEVGCIRDVESGEGVLEYLVRVIALMRAFLPIPSGCSCKERPSPGWWVPGEIPPMATLALPLRV